MKDCGQLEQLIIVFAKGNQSSFAKQMGASQGTIGTWLARKIFDPERIKRAFPQVDGNWLLTGEGEMLLPEDEGNTVHVSGHHNTAKVNSSGSLEVSNYGSFGYPEENQNLQMLKQENASLHALLAEKERLIKVLLGRK